MSGPERPDDPGLTEVEAALGSLSPSAGRLDRDRVMFEAGRASVRRSPVRGVLWPSIAAGLALVALGEAAWLVGRPGADPRSVERVVVVQDEPAPAEEPRIVRTPNPEPPDEVVILHRSSRKGPAAWADRPLPGPSDSSPAALRMRVLRLGIDGLPEPPPLPVALRAERELTTPNARSFRADLNRLLEFGESS